MDENGNFDYKSFAGSIYWCKASHNLYIDIKVLQGPYIDIKVSHNLYIDIKASHDPYIDIKASHDLI